MRELHKGEKIMSELTLEQKKERVKDLRLIDDVFFEVFSEDKKACEEILRVIMQDKELIVESVIVQSSQRNLYGRSVRLDALCILGNGDKVNIEVQRGDNDNHLKRARFNASVITSKDSNPGDAFDDVENVCIIYISEHDFIKGNSPVYHVKKIFEETGQLVEDGLTEIFVNTAVKDGSIIAELMDCFTKKYVDNSSFPNVTRRVKELKETEGGLGAVCEVMEKYMAEAAEKAAKKAAAETEKKTLIKTTLKNYLRFNASKEETISALMEDCNLSAEESERQYEEYVKSLTCSS